MHKLTKDRVRWRLRNWGRWAGSGVDDPALVHYYTVSPMFQEAPFLKERQASRPRIDEADAEATEQVILSMARWAPFEFEYLRSHYAYELRVKDMAKKHKVSLATAYRMRDRAEEYFLQEWNAKH